MMLSTKFLNYFFLLVGGMLLQANAGAQDENLVYKDAIYDEYIHTAQLYPYRYTNFEDYGIDDPAPNNFVDLLQGIEDGTVLAGNPILDQMNYPIIELNNNTKLVLSFDDFQDETRNLIYTIQHCTPDWQPSELFNLDYLDGFTEGEIETYDFSINTIKPYTNYRLILPNNEVRWTKSGNYLLKVYDNTYDKKLIITKRFSVYDPKVSISAKFLPSAKDFNENQELIFEVYHKGISIRNPLTEVTAVVLQNNRWDNAIYVKKPRLARNETLFYTSRGKFSFGAGKEFRYLDLRSLEYKRHTVAQLKQLDNIHEVLLFGEEPRFDRSFLRTPDMNGRYVVDNSDQSGNFNIRADYGEVLFTYKTGQELEDKDVYISGNFTNWSTSPQYKMTYNPLIFSYVAKLILKQGVYEYMYTTTPKDKPNAPLSLADTEGNWYETENEYTILFYYHPFGSEYAQLIGINSFDTSQFNSLNRN